MADEYHTRRSSGHFDLKSGSGARRPKTFGIMRRISVLTLALYREEQKEGVVGPNRAKSRCHVITYETQTAYLSHCAARQAELPKSSSGNGALGSRQVTYSISHIAHAASRIRSNLNITLFLWASGNRT